MERSQFSYFFLNSAAFFFWGPFGQTAHRCHVLSPGSVPAWPGCCMTIRVNGRETALERKEVQSKGGEVREPGKDGCWRIL